MASLTPIPTHSEPPEHVAELLARRDDARSAEASVSGLAALAAQPGAPVDTQAALLQARFFWAEQYLKDGARLRAFRDNISDGLRTLSQRASLPLKSFDDVDAQLHRVPREAAGLLFWTSLSYARTIESLSIFSRLPAARRFRRALDRLVALDEAYFHAGPHRALAAYLAQAPGIAGGDRTAAVRHARRAIDLAPQFAANRVNYAEVLMRSNASKPAWQSELRGALETQAAAMPQASMPEQKVAQARARALLAGAALE